MDYKTVMVRLGVGPAKRCLPQGSRRSCRTIRSARRRRCRFGPQAANVFRGWRFCAEASRRGGGRHPEALVGTRGGFSRQRREARHVGGVALRPGAAGAIHAAAGEGRRYHRGRRPSGNHGRSLRGSGSERSGDAGRPSAHCGASSRAVAGFEKRCCRLEGRAGSAPGRVRRAADPGGGKRSHDRGNSRTGRRSRRCDVAGCRRGRRGCAATVSRPTQSFPKSPRKSANSSTRSPPTSAPAP